MHLLQPTQKRPDDEEHDQHVKRCPTGGVKPGTDSLGPGDADHQCEHAPGGDIIDSRAGNGHRADLAFMQIALGEDPGQHGKAVMLIDAPMNSATERNCMCGEWLKSRGKRISVNAVPSKKGATILTWLITTAACPRLRINLGSSSRPTRNRKKMTPTWLSTFR